MRIPALALWLTLGVPVGAFADGDVKTTQTETTIAIKGDASANEYDVKYTTDAQGNDVLRIEGKNGTTINGTPTFDIRLNADPNRFEEVTIDDGGGADKVTVDLSNLPAAKRLHELTVDGANGGTTTVKNVQMDPGGKLQVNTGGDVTVDTCDTTGLKIDGFGDGTVTVKNCNVEGKLTVDTTNTDATITIQDSFFQDGKVKGGGKVDVQNRLNFRIERTAARKVSFTGGSGDDEVAFEDSSFEQASAKMGGGDDLVSFSGAEIGKVGVDGGAGDFDCFDDTGGSNTFVSLKTKGFEDGACSGFVLDFGPPGQNPFAEPPEGAVAWRVVNGGHQDGPFALPGASNPLGLPELDPASLTPPAHWGQGPECTGGMTQLFHVHDVFDGHADPDEDGCGHGVLSWGFLVPT